MRRSIVTVIFLFSCLLACCSRTDINRETGQTDVVRNPRQQENRPQPVPPAVQAKKAAVQKSKPANPPPISSMGGTAGGEEGEKIDWGKEATAGEVVAMAKNGEIREIAWHIMPNILRAVASDGRVFFIRNESKGLDMRGMLVKSGVQVGKGGIPFHHVF